MRELSKTDLRPSANWGDALMFINLQTKEIEKLSLKLKQSESHREQMAKEICEDGVKLEKLRDEVEKLRVENDKLREAFKFIKRYSTEKPFSELQTFHREVGEIAKEALGEK